MDQAGYQEGEVSPEVHAWEWWQQGDGGRCPWTPRYLSARATGDQAVPHQVTELSKESRNPYNYMKLQILDF